MSPKLTCCQFLLLGLSKVTLVSLTTFGDDSIQADIRGTKGTQCLANITTVHCLINGIDS